MRILPIFVLTVAAGGATHASLAAEPAHAGASAATLAQSGFSRGGALPKWVSPLAPVPPTTRTDAIVMRLWEVQAQGGAAPATLVNQAVQVNDTEALAAIGQYSFSYNPAYEKVRLQRVVILRGADIIDRTAQASVRLLEREQGLDAGVYGGEKSVQLLLEDVRVGDTLWVTYITEGANPVFGKRLAREYNLARSTPVELRRITLLHPAAEPLQWRLLGSDATPEPGAGPAPAPVAPVIDRIGDMTRLRFETRASEAIEYEASMPGEVRPVPAVQFSQYADWHAVALWADGLFPQRPAAAPIKALAARFANESDQMARAGAALRYVQEEIRYFSVSIGENSHRPQAPETVLARRYGDCKDKSYLLVTLLAQLGIEARPVLLNSSTKAMADAMLPTPTVFDHAIVQITIDGKSYLVDPTRTGQRGRLDRLPAVFPGARGLLVAAASEALFAFPEDRDTRPLLELTENVDIADLEGDAVLESRLLYRGRYGEWARRHFTGAGAAQLRRESLARYEKAYPGVTLSAPPQLRDDAADGSYEVVARFKLPKPVSRKDDLYIFDYDSQIMDESLGIPAKVVRRFPLALAQGAYRGRYLLNLRWPQNVRAADTPAAGTLDTPWFAAHEEYALRGNLVTHMVDYRIKNASVAAGEVPALSKQSKALNALASGQWRIGGGTVTPADYARFSLRDFWLTQDLQSLPDDAAAAAKLTDIDDICDMAIRASRLQQVHAPSPLAGMAAFMAPLAAQPDSQPVRNCRARLAFNEGRFAEAVTLSAAPASKTARDDSMPLTALAWARLHAGDSAGAVADSERYVAERDAAGTLTALDAAHAIALHQRAGRPLPPVLAQFATQFADGPWPRPVLTLQTGAAGEAAMFDALAALPASARELPSEEAWFFAGQRRLLAGDKSGAMQAFQSVVDSGTVRGMLAPLARAELAALQPVDREIAAAQAAALAGDQPGAARLLQAAAARGVAAAYYELGLAATTGAGADGKRDPVNALRLAGLAEQGGDVNGTNLLGALYLSGLGVPVDLHKARPLLERAMAGGAPPAPRNLSGYYWEGLDGVPRDRAKAIALLRLSAARNDTEAQSRLAAALFEGIGGAVDDSQAWYWARRAALRGDGTGLRLMALMLLQGRSVTRDAVKGVQLLQAGADAGDSDAMLMLAQQFELGEGAPKDPAKAEALLLRAAAAGNLEALRMQGYRLLFLRHDAAGTPLLERAAAAGHGAAAALLAEALVDGKTLPSDPQRARALLLPCAERGDAICQQVYGMYLQFGRFGAPDYAAAAGWYRKAGEQNMAVSLNNLADLYENGRGVTQDYAASLRLYRQSAQLRLPMAFISLGSLYEKGLGVTASPQTAYTMYLLARRMRADAEAGGGSAEPDERIARLDASLDAPQRAVAASVAGTWKPGMALPGEAVK